MVEVVRTVETPSVPHPAKYNDALIPIFARVLAEYGVQSVLDPMAGVGKIGKLREYGFLGQIVANEIEPEWAEQISISYPYVEVHVGDAAHMDWAADGEFESIVVSPTYGNRMADHHEARDGSRRYTYRHTLGRPLHPANTGQLQWGEAYRKAHRRIWAECVRVLAPGGVFVLNVKDHIRRGRVMRVSEWHAEALQALGLVLVQRIQVPLMGTRNGENGHLRVGHEDVWVLQKPHGGRW